MCLCGLVYCGVDVHKVRTWSIDTAEEMFDIQHFCKDATFEGGESVERTC